MFAQRLAVAAMGFALLSVVLACGGTNGKPDTAGTGKSLSPSEKWLLWVKLEQARDPNWKPPTHGDLSLLKTIDHCIIAVEVLQMLPGTGMLADSGGKTVIIEGDFSGMVDGDSYMLDGLFTTRGTRTYKTVLGAAKTVACYAYHGKAPSVPKQEVKASESIEEKPVVVQPAKPKTLAKIVSADSALVPLGGSKLELSIYCDPAQKSEQDKLIKRGRIVLVSAGTAVDLTRREGGYCEVMYSGEKYYTASENVQKE